MTKHDAERKVKILDFIAATLRARGYPPSVREIARAVGLASTSAVHHHLQILEREGYLERGAAQSRAIRLTPTAALRLGCRRARPAGGHEDAHVLPIIGEIAAGGPIEAYQDASETMAIPDMLAPGGRRLRPPGPRRLDDRGPHRRRRLRPHPPADHGPQRRHRRRPGRGERRDPQALLQGEGPDPPPAREPGLSRRSSTPTSGSRASSSESSAGSTEGGAVTAHAGVGRLRAFAHALQCARSRARRPPWPAPPDGADRRTSLRCDIHRIVHILAHSRAKFVDGRVGLIGLR